MSGIFSVYPDLSIVANVYVEFKSLFYGFEEVVIILRESSAETNRKALDQSTS